MTKITKVELEYLLSAKAGAERYPGYFKEEEFVRSPCWVAKLGKQTVYIDDGTCLTDSGGYLTRADALRAAEAFREKLRTMLETGDYVEATTH
jgi:hypothetical protein